MKGESLPRLLIFELRLMGDAVMSLPFVRAAQGSFEVHVCCSPASEPVFRLFLPAPQVHRWTPFWRKGGVRYPLGALGEMNELLRLLRRLDATHAVCAWCDPRTGALMALAGAPYRIGFSAAPANLYGDHLPWRRKQLRFARWIERFAAVLMRRPLLTNQLLRRHHAQHHIQDWQQVADALGLAMDTSEPCLALGTGVRHAEPAERRRRIVIHPGASEPQKRWPLEGFLRLARSLGAEYDVLLIEPPELRFDSSIHSSFPVATTRDIPELVGYLRESDVLIGNDSGVAHLADAMGNPVISIFLASQPGHFAPYGSRNYVISFSESCDVRPCYGRCTKPGFICHLPATYEDVEARVRAHLGAILDTGGMERRH